MRILTLRKDLVDQYWADGVLCLRGVLDRDWIDRMHRAAQSVVESPSPAVRYSRGSGDRGRFIRDRFMWTFNEDFRAFACDSPLPGLAAQILRSAEVRLLIDLIFTKEPNTPDPTPWHHDQPYGWYDGAQVCQFWIPLDRVDLESGTLEFVRGSHKWGKWFNLINFVDQSYETRDYQDLPDIDGHRDEYDIVHFDMDPGDCVVFSELTLHSAPGNRSDRIRHGVALHYSGDDARYAVRKYSRIPVADPGLKHGDPIGGKMFPRVWPRERAASELR